MQADEYPTLSPEGHRLLVTFALACTAILGLLALWTPFHYDQSLFAYGGRTIASGGVLYRDFWDIKQPGIFFFYALAGSLFGFIEPGIHALELIWQLGGALVLTWIAQQCVRNPAVAAVAPIFTLGAYYSFTTSWHMTQVEALVGPPLALSLAMVFRLTQRPHSAATSFFLGVSAATVGAFKLVYLTIPSGFALILVAKLLRQRELSFKVLLRVAGYGLLGVITVWLPLVGYFALHGALPEFLWTTFGYPVEALKEVPLPPTERLRSSFEWTLDAFLPFSPLILLGLTTIRRARQPVLALGVVLYLLMGTVLIVLQKFSWWEYHQVLLFPPLGLLATLGLDRITGAWRAARRSRHAIALVALIISALPFWALVRQSYGKITDLTAALQMDSKASLSIRLDEKYRKMWMSTAFIRRRNSYPGSVYVLGDPRYVLLSHRRQAIPVHGHAWLHLPAQLWQRLPSELIAAEPAYFFLSDYDRRILRLRSPELLEFLDSRYHYARKGPGGRWLANNRIATEWENRRTKRRMRKSKT